MILDKEWFTFVVNPLVCVRAVSIHMAIPVWSPSIGEKDHDLMKSFWREGPEIPSILSRLNACLRVSFLGMNEIWELDWIPDEEYRCVVSDHIVISFLGIELDSPSSWISVAVICSAFSSNSGET